jgi:hypothetical protein
MNSLFKLSSLYYTRNTWQVDERSLQDWRFSQWCPSRTYLWDKYCQFWHRAIECEGRMIVEVCKDDGWKSLCGWYRECVLRNARELDFQSPLNAQITQAWSKDRWYSSKIVTCIAFPTVLNRNEWESTLPNLPLHVFYSHWRLLE